jgi:hypothetical protein
MSELGLSVPVLIDEYLRPLLKATETKFAQDDGKFSDFIDVENLDVRDRALDKAFRLHGAYAPKDPKEAVQFGIKVVIIDVPRPQHGTFMPDVGPAKLPPSNGFNGHKPQTVFTIVRFRPEKRDSPRLANLVDNFVHNKPKYFEVRASGVAVASLREEASSDSQMNEPGRGGKLVSYSNLLCVSAI